jgi:hypothetical protein
MKSATVILTVKTLPFRSAYRARKNLKSTHI